MHRSTAHVPAPSLDLTDDTPVSSAFGDVYFSRGGGVAETEHVFLAGNGLPARWQETPFNDTFTIAELGFGTGLNFLVTLKRFRETTPAGMVLHYLAIEKYPFTHASLRAVLALQPELAGEAAELLAAYPLRLPGIHRIHLSRCVLTLYIGEVAAMLDEIAANQPPESLADRGIDAWYLDGFSPAKNPEMWQPEILARVGKLSMEGTSFATFTSAGEVRRGLMEAGFVVKKVAGFGHKREMSVGHIPLVEKATRSADGPRARHLIIGAGIAGATLARALAERGVPVTVLERGQVASGASGNAAGVLFPQLTKQWNNSTAWYFAAYGFALRQLARWQAKGLIFRHATTGMLRLPRHAEEETQLRGLQEALGIDASIVHWLERDAASTQAGLSLQTGAAYFPHGTWMNPAECCKALLQHEHIMLREESAAISIARVGEKWAVTLASGEVIEAPHLYVTSAHESAALLQDYGLMLGAVGGQVSEIASHDAATGLRSILCHKGYVIPLGDRYLVGATYHREEMLAVTHARHEENITQLNAIVSDWPPVELLGGRSSIRATTPDRMPYIGTLDEGLYVSTGHGSRGLLNAPLAAELLASNIVGDMAPVTQVLAQAVHPLRFRKA